MLNYQRVIVIIYPDMDERWFLAPGGSPYHLAMRSGASWDDQTINKSRVFYPVSHPPKRMFLKKYRGFAGQGSNHISAAGSARSSLCTSERYAANCLCLWRRLETFQVSLYTVSWLVVTFFIFPYWEFHHPNWLIFFRGVETTNQSWSEVEPLVFTVPCRLPRPFPRSRPCLLPAWCRASWHLGTVPRSSWRGPGTPKDLGKMMGFSHGWPQKFTFR